MAAPAEVRMRFDHVSIAVKSIDRTAEFFTRYFPVQQRSPKTRDDQVSGAFYWQDFHLGGFVVELIEDLPGRPGFVTKFIERHGEGMHHLSVEVNHLDPIVEKLRAGGVRVVDEQKYPSGSATAFISPRSAFGALIQFWQVPDFDTEHKHQPPSDGRAAFDHVSLAVRDIHQAYDYFSKYFTPSSIDHEPHLVDDGNFALGHMQVAGFKLEFIQSPPGGGKNDFVGKFIDRYGEGMHHITLVLGDFEGTVARLKTGGVRVVDESINWRGEKEAYVSPRDAFGVLIQLWSTPQEE
ncbi:MAG TPA: VOC family protein [Candidatus Binataceae bacterium]|nr:VOC family protein [Candidatus Binataceae bacterium]